MSWTADDIPDQSGRTAVVTGANSGIGEIAARELRSRARRWCSPCRNTEKGDEAAAADPRRRPGRRGRGAQARPRRPQLGPRVRRGPGARQPRPARQQRRPDGAPPPRDQGRLRDAVGHQPPRATSRSPACCSIACCAARSRASSPCAAPRTAGPRSTSTTCRAAALLALDGLRAVQARQPAVRVRAAAPADEAGSPLRTSPRTPATPPRTCRRARRGDGLLTRFEDG